MVVVVLAATVFLRTFVNASFYSPDDAAPVSDIVTEITGVASALAGGTDAGMSGTKPAAAKPAPKPIPANYPMQLEIPSIYVNAKMQQTTINSKGAMGVPTNFSDVAWYVNGVVPGNLGTAVIDGHFDNGLGMDGVFKHLDQVQNGEEVVITRKDGKKLRYKITSVEHIAYDDPATAHKVFDPQTHRSEIKLVTCGGSWVPETKTYQMRIIVTAVLVE